VGYSAVYLRRETECNENLVYFVGLARSQTNLFACTDSRHDTLGLTSSHKNTANIAPHNTTPHLEEVIRDPAMTKTDKAASQA
jgi:hypothetical protein